MSDNSSSGGMGFCGVLAIVFITLKLVGVITWSWWWVLSPIWLPFVVALAILAVIGAVAGIAALAMKSLGR